MPARDVSRSNVIVGDGWSDPVAVYGGRVLTIDVNANAIEVQLSSTQPPNPPLWGDTVRLIPGQWSRARAFGYFRYRNATKGAVAAIDYIANAE